MNEHPVTHTVQVDSSEYDLLCALRAKVLKVLAERYDEVCWLDVYRDLARILGRNFDPVLLPREKFLTNCSHYYDCLAGGRPYEAPYPSPEDSKPEGGH